MEKIFKYGIKVEDKFTIMMPHLARILTVQVQEGTPFIWALVDTGQPLSERVFSVVATGDNVGLGTYMAPFNFITENSLDIYLKYENNQSNLFNQE